jgi:hypothetical protein
MVLRYGLLAIKNRKLVCAQFGNPYSNENLSPQRAIRQTRTAKALRNRNFLWLCFRS